MPPIVALNERRGTAVTETQGAVAESGLVFGCYVHGLLDAEPLRAQLLAWLCRRKGLDPATALLPSTVDADRAFNDLADLLDQHLDMRRLEALIRATPGSEASRKADRWTFCGRR